MPEQGVVRIFYQEKGFGFLSMDNNDDIFFHKNKITPPVRTIYEQQRALFDLMETEKGLTATNIKLIVNLDTNYLLKQQQKENNIVFVRYKDEVECKVKEVRPNDLMLDFRTKLLKKIFILYFFKADTTDAVKAIREINVDVKEMKLKPENDPLYRLKVPEEVLEKHFNDKSSVTITMRNGDILRGFIFNYDDYCIRLQIGKKHRVILYRHSMYSFENYISPNKEVIKQEEKDDLDNLIEKQIEEIGDTSNGINIRLLSEMIAKDVNLTMSDCINAVDVIQELIIKEVETGGKVTITDFGTFSLNKKSVLSFTPGKKFKESVV